MPLKTLIIDDTIIYRKIMTDLLKQFADEIEVVGIAATGDIALKKMAQQSMDLVFCDVYMPGKDGVATLAAIKQLYPETVVVMMSSISTRSADITIKALEMGALDFIRKPDHKTIGENIEQLKTDIKSILRLISVKRCSGTTVIERRPKLPVVKLPTPAVPDVEAPATGITIPHIFKIVAIGVSTGGPEALNKLIPKLPENFPVPVLLVQHMPPQFTKSLADSLDAKSKIRVIEVSKSMPLEAGTVYIASGGYHMIVRNTNGSVEVCLNTEPPENSCRPSVDVLFRSVASVYGSSGILAVVMTGMGTDGVNGVRALKRKGCYCITQTEESCVVYGMPRAVEEAKLSNISLPVEEIADELCRRTNCKSL